MLDNKLKSFLLDSNIQKYGEMHFEYNELAQERIRNVEEMVQLGKEVEDIFNYVDTCYAQKVTTIIVLLSEHGIFDYSVDYFKEINSGYAAVCNACADYYKYVIDVTKRQDVQASNQLSSAANTAKASIHGLDYGIIGDPIQLWIYDSFNESEVRRTTEKAEKYFESQKRAILNFRDSNVNYLTRQYYNNTFSQQMCKAVAEMYTVLFHKHIELLCTVGELDQSSIDAMDEKRCHNIMKNLMIVNDKKALLMEAVRQYPFNTSMYLEAVKAGVFDEDFAYVVRMIDPKGYTVKQILDTWNVEKIVVDDTENSRHKLEAPLSAVALIRETSFDNEYGFYVRNEAFRRLELANNEYNKVSKNDIESTEVSELEKVRRAFDYALIALHCIPDSTDSVLKGHLINESRSRQEHIEKDIKYCTALNTDPRWIESSIQKYEELGDWRDSKARLVEARIIKSEKDAEKEREKLKKEKQIIKREKLKKRKPYMVAAVLVASAVGIGCFLYHSYFKPTSIYNDAMELYKAGEYAEAQELFEDLHYRTSDKMVVFCKSKRLVNKEKYEEAVSLLSDHLQDNGTDRDILEEIYNISFLLVENNRFDEAERVLAYVASTNDKDVNIETYRKKLDVRYLHGKYCLENEDYETAKSIFEDFDDYYGNYPDIEELENKAKAGINYNKGVKNEEDGKYEAAKKYYGYAAEYSIKDSGKRLKLMEAFLLVEKADGKYEKDWKKSVEDYDKALVIYDDLGSALGGTEYAQNLRYRLAKELVSAGRYKTALKYLEPVEGYEDSAEILVTVRSYLDSYESACSNYNNGDWEAVITDLEDLGNYKDSNKMREIAESNIAMINAYNKGVMLEETADEETDTKKKLEYLVQASSSFLISKDYSDSLERVYMIAEQFLEYDEYEKSSNLFSQLGNYKDSADRIEEIPFIEYYDNALNKEEKAFAAEKTEDKVALLVEAANDLLSIIDYSDSKECVYRIASELFELDDVENSKAFFTELGDYKDSMANIELIEERTINKMLEEAEIGSIVNFGKGKYHPDDKDSSDYQWVVLDKKENKVFLLLRYALTDSRYIKRKRYSYLEDDADWVTSYVREKLNGDFYNQSFSEKEKAHISEETIDNAGNKKFGTRGCVDTTDKVFLLSVKEAKKYLNISLVKNCIWRASNEKCHWMLRSGGDKDDHYAYVSKWGDIYIDGTDERWGDPDSWTIIRVRPAMWVSFEDNTNSKGTNIDEAVTSGESDMLSTKESNSSQIEHSKETESTEVNEQNNWIYPNAYNTVSDCLRDYPGSMLGDIIQGYSVIFGISDIPSENVSYSQCKAVARKVAKQLGAEKRNGAYLTFRGLRVSHDETMHQFSFSVQDESILIRIRNRADKRIWIIDLCKDPDADTQKTYPEMADNFASAANVLFVQKELSELGYDVGVPDGIMGAKTSACIMQYRLDNDLTGEEGIDLKLMDHIITIAEKSK